MHGVILLAIFVGALSVALAVAAERPGIASLALLVWGGWPLTLLPGHGDLARGALLAAAVLLLLAGAAAVPGRRVLAGIAIGALVVLTALGASSSPAVAKNELLRWQKWDPYNRPEKPVGVRYVWDSNYTGIHFPRKVTDVFHVSGVANSYYWRATTLDVYAGSHWRSAESPIGPERASGVDNLTFSEPLLPKRALRSSHWVKQTVTIDALKDDHLPGAATPVAYSPGDVPDVRYADNGSGIAPLFLQRDQSYVVWSYAPEPTPRQLARSEPVYPAAVLPFLAVDPGAETPRFGAADRAARMHTFFEQYRDLQVYRPLYRSALDVAGTARTPYGAAVALEAWFRTSPIFTYDETPPQAAGGVPPLVGFVEQTHRGYCQHFAGAMALMLRYLGIPARVAAGFTSGKYDADKHTWTVTDHDAHAWVEVWFKGWGWLPFDPTPARGELAASYTTASPHFDPRAALIGAAGFDAKRVSDFGFSAAKGVKAFNSDVPRQGGGGSGGTGGAVVSHGASLFRLLLIVLAAALLLVVALKLLVRRGRYLTRDPRRVAAACRRELADYLADQRVAIPSSATPNELAELVNKDFAIDARPFAQALAGARFGPPAGARAAAAEARRELRRLVRLLRSRLSRTERALGLVSVRSLGLTR
jgi:transglutaminase-like putative cysteine protease